MVLIPFAVSFLFMPSVKRSVELNCQFTNKRKVAPKPKKSCPQGRDMTCHVYSISYNLIYLKKDP